MSKARKFGVWFKYEDEYRLKLAEGFFLRIFRARRHVEFEDGDCSWLGSLIHERTAGVHELLTSLEEGMKRPTLKEAKTCILERAHTFLTDMEHEVRKGILDGIG